MTVDIHLHTRFSFDSEELPENYVKRAIACGERALGFSEHYDYDAFLDGELRAPDIPAYVAYADALKNSAPCELLTGIEFGYRADCINEYSRVEKQFPFDYIINSVHTLPGRGDCYHTDRFFAGKSLKQGYCDYLKAILESVKAPYDFQVVGHIGYASRYCKGDDVAIKYADFSELLDEILSEIISRGKCLEINTSVGTSGSRFLPDRDIIERYIKLGGKIMSFGSDAHTADKYLKNAEAVKEMLLSLGICEMYYFKNRRQVAYKI